MTFIAPNFFSEFVSHHGVETPEFRALTAFLGQLDFGTAEKFKSSVGNLAKICAEQKADVGGIRAVVSKYFGELGELVNNAIKSELNLPASFMAFIRKHAAAVDAVCLAIAEDPSLALLAVNASEPKQNAHVAEIEKLLLRRLTLRSASIATVTVSTGDVIPDPDRYAQLNLLG